MVTDNGVHAEDLFAVERLVVAPRAGIFHPSSPDVSTTNPEWVAAGDEIGAVVHMGEKHPVRARFAGMLLGLLVLPGERVQAHQAVAWLTTDTG